MQEVFETKSLKVKTRQEIRILDPNTRQKRKERQLESLEKDACEDENIQMTAGKQTTVKEIVKKRKKVKTGEHFKQRFRKNFASLIEEAEFTCEQPNYITARAPPSDLPMRKFCAVCGFPSVYNCVVCGELFCCLECQTVHKDTRCMKWVA